MDSYLPTVGVTMGDPCGIGPEIVVKALSDPLLRAQGRFVVYGFSELLDYAADLAEVDFDCHRGHHDQPGDILPGGGDNRSRHIATGASVSVLDYDELPTPAAGQHEPTHYGGRASLLFLEDAIVAARKGHLDALVTAPISKQAWHLAGCRFPGHTELLAKRTKAKRVAMMLVAPQLKVVLATIHEPLFEVRQRLNIGSVFDPLELADKALRQWFGIRRPRLAVCGLNPHAGEGGRFGDEESRILEPAIVMAAEAGVDVEGPFPADALFHRAVAGEFDCVLALYHDQGLIPIKLLAWRQAVNLTLGLPFVRTSPAHGTAYDIAGRNKADASSMKAALALALELARKRAGA